MNPVLQHLINTNFSDLRGSKIDGQLALSDELVNLGIHDFLAQLKSPPSQPAPAPKSASGSAPDGRASDEAGLPDPKEMLQHVTIDTLRYRTEAGRTVLEISAKV